MWNMIKSIGTRCRIGIIAAMPWLLLLVFVLLHIAIWWLGPSFEWQDHHPLGERSQRWFASGGLLLIAATVWGWSQYVKVKRYQERDRKTAQRIQDPFIEIIEDQESEFNAVFDEMKSHMGRRDALYGQPWYVLLGEQGSGKSQFIQRSGLSFLFSTVLNASKTQEKKSFDWWVGNEAVVIDPDGALITQDTSPSPEGEIRQWRHFIDWLEQTRSRRPLNGVVVTIDVIKLIERDEASRLAYAAQIRSRLKELMETVASRLPVYVVLTKWDGLNGFEPFFRYCNAAERASILGFTYSLQSLESTDEWLTEFSRDYDRLIAQLNALLIEYEGGRSVVERQAMFSFVKQVSGLKHGLQAMLETMFLRDKFSTPVLLRGTYFTSVEQQGVPHDIFDDAIARRYQLTAPSRSAQQAKQSLVYFASSLFENAIIPESGLATDNLKVLKQKRRLILHATMACGLATILLLVGWQHSYEENRQRAENVLAKVRLYQGSEQDRPYSPQAMLASLEQIRSAMLAYGFFHEKPKYISEMGLYQGHTIGPKVESTYLELLNRQFLPLLMNELMAELSQAHTNEEKLAVLRVYRMMTDQSGRQRELVMNHFAKLWHHQFMGQRETQQALLHHLQYALEHTDLEGAKMAGDYTASAVLRPFEGEIAKVQAKLSLMSNEERVYRNLRSSARSVLGAPLNMRQLVGPSFDVVFLASEVHEERLLIPRFLTKDGFENYFLPQMRSVSRLALTDSWVLGQTQTAKFSDADEAALQEKIQALYIADYTRTWREALNTLDVQAFANLDDAVLVLDSFVSNTEPLQKVLRTLKQHTQLYQQPDDERAQKAMQTSTAFKLATAIETPFSRLNGVLVSPNGEESNINQLLASVSELDNYLKSIQEAPDRGMAALEATQTRMALKNVDPIYTLKRISRGLPAPLDTLMEKVADESWYVIKQEAIQYLNVRWQTDVYKVFETQFAHRYPFEPSASKDVSLKDFETFFAPEGTLDSFYSEQLKGFVDEASNNQHIVKEDVLTQFEQAKAIQQAFFNRKGVLGVNFVIEPTHLSNNKRRSVLNVDGQLLSYSHGSRENIEMIWPNTLRERAISKVTLIPNQSNVSPRSVVANGPWALFRLLDQGEVTSASTTSVDYQFDVDSGAMTYRLSSEANVNPFTSRLLASFSLASSLY
ncbi:type VI secretion system membrane subunit TssM [Vibrio parahaemolyticus]|uniref:type VI secretion system membrane subunit TssM n=1 Tax=Vibrio parahaemolyticus TaxID=670 RepID=UPI003D649139